MTSFPPAGPAGSEPGGQSQPEYLHQGGGAPVARRTGAGGRRTALVAGGVLGLAAVGGGVWAAMAFLGTGAQPAEALPASTLGYVSVDLDPSGAQKVEAVRTLRKFAGFRDEIGLQTDDDVRRFLFDEVASDACPDVDYAEDVESWLGDRGAVAAIDTGEEEPAAVLVLQVRDEDAADAGLGALRECLGGTGSTGTGGDPGAWVVDGGWAVVAETQEVADQVAADAAEAPLSEDEDFTRWTGEAGGAGLATLYAAPEAGRYVSELAGDLGGLGMLGTTGFVEPGTAAEDDVTSALEQFEGMAATLRFDDGALELEAASGSGTTEDLQPTEDAGRLVADLPERTAVALGLGLGEGWFGTLLDGFAAGLGEDPEAAVEQLTGITGLELPEDVETLTEGGVAVALGDDFDPEGLFTGEGALPLAAVLGGDPVAIEAVLDKLPPGVTEQLLGRTVDEDDVVVGPDAEWREEVAAGGDLGSSEHFRDVVSEADRATGLVYVDFDAAWVAELASQDPEVEGNLGPLAALGISWWLDDDVSRTLVRVSTD